MVVVLLLAAVSFVWQEPAVCHGRAQFAVRGAEPDPERSVHDELGRVGVSQHGFISSNYSGLYLH